jgi:threonine/homoserine/homoserine lactone efflux protein
LGRLYLFKYVGAIYLFYIGITTFLKANQANETTDDLEKKDVSVATKSNKEYFGQGVLTNILNPKASIFYLTLLPQFVIPGENPFIQLIILGFTAVIVVTFWFLFLSYAFDHICSWLNKPSFKVNFQRVTGLMLITFGIKLALAKR